MPETPCPRCSCFHWATCSAPHAHNAHGCPDDGLDCHPPTDGSTGRPLLLDVYAGPVGVEAYHEAVAALRALEADHEAQEHVDHPGGDCPGWEVCSSVGAFALRAIREVLR